MLPINNKIHSEKTVGVANRLVEEWAKTRQKFVFYVPRVFYSLLLLLLLVARYQQSRFTK